MEGDDRWRGRRQRDGRGETDTRGAGSDGSSSAPTVGTLTQPDKGLKRKGKLVPGRDEGEWKCLADPSLWPGTESAASRPTHTSLPRDSSTLKYISNTHESSKKPHKFGTKSALHSLLSLCTRRWGNRVLLKYERPGKGGGCSNGREGVKGWFQWFIGIRGVCADKLEHITSARRICCSTGFVGSLGYLDHPPNPKRCISHLAGNVRETPPAH